MQKALSMLEVVCLSDFRVRCCVGIFVLIFAYILYGVMSFNLLAGKFEIQTPSIARRYSLLSAFNQQQGI